MAEVVGLVASIIGIAEAGVKIATALGKLSVKLKNAGKEAKEIARKIKLVSKVLKQIEIKLKDGRSSIDLSLVEDYILICEERMEEAARLVEVLESEMNSSSKLDRARFRIRFILEKSTFTILQQDMDSLQLTMDLYVTTLTYQQLGKNEMILEEIQDKLTELKQELEDDLLVRSASTTVNAAILTVQYNNIFSTNISVSSRSPGSETVVEEPETGNRDDEIDTVDLTSDQSLALTYSRSGIGSFDSNQAVPLNVLDEDTVSKALVVFTQIQMVQKKTLRRVNLELEKEPEPSVPRPLIPTVVESNTANTQSNQTKHDLERQTRLQSQDEISTTGRKVGYSDASNASRSVSSNIHEQPSEPEHEVPFSQESSSQRLDGLEQVNDEPADTPAGLSDTRLTYQRERETFADRYSGEYFLIVNCKTSKAIHIDFLDLRKSTLLEIVLDMHMMSLNYKPPKPPAFPASDFTDYLPPPRPTPHSPVRLPTNMNHKSKSRLRTAFSSSTEKGKSGLALVPRHGSGTLTYREEDVFAFAAYVVAYAQWYTDSCRLTALRNHEYRICVDEKDFKKEAMWYEKMPVDRVVNDNHMEFDKLYGPLTPGTMVTIEFTTRQLIPENIVRFRYPIDGITYYLVDEAPYREDLNFISGYL